MDRYLVAGINSAGRGDQMIVRAESNYKAREKVLSFYRWRAVYCCDLAPNKKEV